MDVYKLDIKDKKILYELDRNARRSYSEIGRNVRLSKEVVKYRIDRMVEIGLIIRFHTVVNYFKLGIVKYKLYLRLMNVNKEKLEEIGEYFKNHKKTEWVVTCTGKWDMIVGFLVHNINEFDDEVQDTLNRFAGYIEDKSITATLYLAHHVREFLKDNKELRTSSRVVYHTTADKREEIDDMDVEILKIITNNARMSAMEMAKRMHTTPRVVQYRIKQLERNGVILAYKVQLDPRKMGNIFCKAIIYLKSTTKDRINEFKNYCFSIPQAVWPQRVIGAWDFELDFEIETYDKFQDIMLGIKEKFSDIIKDYDFIIVSKEFKLDFFPGCYPTIT